MIFAIPQLLWTFGPAIFWVAALIITTSVFWHIGRELVEHHQSQPKPQTPAEARNE